MLCISLGKKLAHRFDERISVPENQDTPYPDVSVRYSEEGQTNAAAPPQRILLPAPTRQKSSPDTPNRKDRLRLWGHPMEPYAPTHAGGGTE